jgi:phytol kinase
MLRIYRDMPAPELWKRLGVLVALAAFHWHYRKRAHLREGTLFGALLVVYLCWIFGGLPWIAAPMTVIVLHPLLEISRSRGEAPERHCHEALLAVGVPPLAWLFLDRLAGMPGFAPFNAVLGAQLAMIAASLWRAGRHYHGILLVPLAVALGWGATVLPWWLAGWISTRAAMGSAAATVVSSLVFHIVQPSLENKPIRHWSVRALLASLASLAAM